MIAIAGVPGKSAWWFVALVAMCVAVPDKAFAQADEIQVYDGGLATVGTFNLTVHNNFTPKGGKNPAFAGAVVADKSLNGVPEWALGVTNWFEAGLYMPLYSRTRTTAGGSTGSSCGRCSPCRTPTPHVRVRRELRVQLQRETLGLHALHVEIRPIIGWHLKPFDIIVNPILDTSYDGSKISCSRRPRASRTTSHRDGRWRLKSTPTSGR